MSEENNQQGEKKKRRFSQQQYDMLKRCSDKQDITEWNNWREENLDEEIHLEGADLEETHLEGAFLYRAHLVGAYLLHAHLEGAKLSYAHLEGVYLAFTHLEGVDLTEANLECAYLHRAHLEGARFCRASVDAATSLMDCVVDRQTDFHDVDLNYMRIDPWTKKLLRRNIRRMDWHRWYKRHRILRLLVEPFLVTSDYGLSTSRIIFTLLALALFFASIYYICGLVHPPGVVDNLFTDSQGPLPAWLVPFRAIYFSVVTMTTLGFGDMYAQPRSLAGHLLLTFQVILGYLLLGALITRFSVIFSGDVPTE